MAAAAEEPSSETDKNYIDNIDEIISDIDNNISKSSDKYKEWLNDIERYMYGSNNYLLYNNNNSRNITRKKRLSNAMATAFQMLKESNVHNALSENAKLYHHKIIDHFEIKLLTALFTKGNIYTAVSKYGTGNQIDNLFGLLRLYYIGVNTYLKDLWTPIMKSDYNPYSKYVHSGGNIYVLLASVLHCMCYNINTSTVVNNIIIYVKRRFNKQYGLFIEELRDNYDIYKPILSMISDVDMIFMTKEYDIVNFNINTLTKNLNTKTYKKELKEMKAAAEKCASNANKCVYENAVRSRKRMYSNMVSRSYNQARYHVNNYNYKLTKSNEANSKYTGTYAHKLNQLSHNILCKLLTDNKYNRLFPFKTEKVKNVENVGKVENVKKVKRTTPISIYTMSSKLLKSPTVEKINNGDRYSITSSVIPELNIYINRIKQQYKKNYRKHGKKIYGECLDLVIGSIESDIYSVKHKCYDIHGTFTLEVLKHELDDIKSKTTGVNTQKPKQPFDIDKDTKRDKRLIFLNWMIESEYKEIYEIILKECYIEIMPSILTSSSKTEGGTRKNR